MRMESSPSGSLSPAPSFADSHSLVPLWLVLTLSSLTCEGGEIFSTDRHPVSPCYRGLETKFKNHFHPVETSLQRIFSLQPGTGYLDLVSDLVWYVCSLYVHEVNVATIGHSKVEVVHNTFCLCIIIVNFLAFVLSFVGKLITGGDGNRWPDVICVLPLQQCRVGNCQYWFQCWR